jgi:hypothetical protein
MVIARALLVWLLLMAAETIHGALRNLFLVPAVGDFHARQLGVVIGSVLILAITVLTIGWIGPTSDRSALSIGMLWLALTVAFEFIIGRALGRPWKALLADYDLTRGGLLSLGMIILALAPWVAARLHQSSD